MSKKCAVCEDNAYSFYPLCKKHLEMTKTGEVFKNDEGEWQLKNDKEPEAMTKSCLLCGAPTVKGYHYCKE